MKDSKNDASRSGIRRARSDQIALSPKLQDEVKDWTKIFASEEKTKTIKPDKNYANHMIKPCKMIVVVAPTGGGKSTALVEFLHRKQDCFVEIILFTGSTKDEILYRNLEKHIEGIKIIDDAEELPPLTDYNDEDKTVERLLILDDMINCERKDFIKMQKWFNSSRKYGFTCFALVQNFTDLPIQMRRNAQYFMLFRLNDTRAVSQILSTSSDGMDLDMLKGIYYDVTSKKGHFLTIDLTETGPLRFRQNFIGRIF